MEAVHELALTSLLVPSADWEGRPAAQQPVWGHHPAYRRAREALEASPALVSPAELSAAWQAVAAVASGQARLLQVGDCAESLAEATLEHTSSKVDVLNWLAGQLEEGADQPVARIGRIAGQYAKPRSENLERRGGVDIPTFRGHLINSEEPSAHARAHDPRRMQWAHEASAKVQGWLRSYRAGSHSTRGPEFHSGPWSSHEALVIDYEVSSLRTDPATGSTFLSSTHVPWIGERTRQPDSAHVRLLASVDNPVACKIGPDANAADVVRLCELLDPERVPGRLTLIVRTGRRAIENILPRVAAAVRLAGHPVVWVTDPMHGNTVRTAGGTKTRYLSDITAEAIAFRDILLRQGLYPGGLHLEVAAGEVTECVGGPVVDEDELGVHYTTLCDPRLNPEQAHDLLKAWTRG